MANNDIIIGVLVGLFQGYLFGPLFALFYRCSIYLIARISSSAFILQVIGSLIACLGIGGFFLTLLLLKPVITVWKIFVVSWGLGLTIGVLLCQAVRRRKSR